MPAAINPGTKKYKELTRCRIIWLNFTLQWCLLAFICLLVIIIAFPKDDFWLGFFTIFTFLSLLGAIYYGYRQIKHFNDQLPYDYRWWNPAS